MLDLKYRPQKYSEVLGQKQAISVLKKFVGKDDLPFVFILSGPAGTGKTTVARILAKALTCESPDEGEYCGNCPTCQEIPNVNIVEIDAASNNKVEDARDLICDLQYNPMGTARRRVVILDEAHQLSSAAQNTFLKLFEEGNTSSIFILCTTEPEKILATVRSRACELPFTVADLARLQVLLENVCQAESIRYDSKAISLIARASNGHVRDAIKMVDHIATTGDLLSENVRHYLKYDLDSTVLKMLAAVPSDLGQALAYLDSLLERESPALVHKRIMRVILFVFKCKKKLDKFSSEDENTLSEKVVSILGDSLSWSLKFFLDNRLRSFREELIADLMLLHSHFSDSGKETISLMTLPEQQPNLNLNPNPTLNSNLELYSEAKRKHLEKQQQQFNSPKNIAEVTQIKATSQPNQIEEETPQEISLQEFVSTFEGKIVGLVDEKGNIKI